MNRTKILAFAFTFVLFLSIFVSNIDSVKAEETTFYFDVGDDFMFDEINGTGDYSSNNTFFINTAPSETYTHIFVYTDFAELNNLTEDCFSFSVIRESVVYNSSDYIVDTGSIMGNYLTDFEITLHFNQVSLPEGVYLYNWFIEMTDNLEPTFIPTKTASNVMTGTATIMVLGTPVIHVNYAPLTYNSVYFQHTFGVTPSPDIPQSTLVIDNVGNTDLNSIEFTVNKFLILDGFYTTYPMNLVSVNYLGTEVFFGVDDGNFRYVSFPLSPPLSSGDSINFIFKMYDVDTYITVPDNYDCAIVLHGVSNSDGDSNIEIAGIEYEMISGQYVFTLTYTDSLSYLKWDDIGAGSTNVITSNMALVDEVSGNAYDIGTIDFAIQAGNDFTLADFKLAGNGNFLYSFDGGTTWLSESINSNGIATVSSVPVSTVTFHFKLEILSVPLNAVGEYSLGFNVMLSTNPVFLVEGTAGSSVDRISFRVIWGDETNIYGEIDDYVGDILFAQHGTGEHDTIITDTVTVTEEFGTHTHQLYFILSHYTTMYDGIIPIGWEYMGCYIDVLTEINIDLSRDWLVSITGTYGVYTDLLFNGIDVIVTVEGEDEIITVEMGTSTVPYTYDTNYISGVKTLSAMTDITGDAEIFSGTTNNYGLTVINTFGVTPIPEPIDWSLYFPSGNLNNLWFFSMIISIIAGFVIIMSKSKKGSLFGTVLIIGLTFMLVASAMSYTDEFSFTENAEAGTVIVNVINSTGEFQTDATIELRNSDNSLVLTEFSDDNQQYYMYEDFDDVIYNDQKYDVYINGSKTSNDVHMSGEITTETLIFDGIEPVPFYEESGFWFIMGFIGLTLAVAFLFIRRKGINIKGFGGIIAIVLVLMFCMISVNDVIVTEAEAVTVHTFVPNWETVDLSVGSLALDFSARAGKSGTIISIPIEITCVSTKITDGSTSTVTVVPEVTTGVISHKDVLNGKYNADVGGQFTVDTHGQEHFWHDGIMFKSIVSEVETNFALTFASPSENTFKVWVSGDDTDRLDYKETTMVVLEFNSQIATLLGLTRGTHQTLQHLRAFMDTTKTTSVTTTYLLNIYVPFKTTWRAGNLDYGVKAHATKWVYKWASIDVVTKSWIKFSFRGKTWNFMAKTISIDIPEKVISTVEEFIVALRQEEFTRVYY